MTQEDMELLLGLGIVIVLVTAVVVFYILPGLIASNRRCENSLAIWFITLFFGWTTIGWLAAFIWSVTDRPRKT